MKYEWIGDYCLAKHGVTKDYQPAWDATRYFLGGKMFAMQGGDKTGRPIFTMKLPPALGEALRCRYDDVVPGYYMNKIHWNSLYLDGNVPDGEVREMIDEAYRAALSALPKKIREGLEGTA